MDPGELNLEPHSDMAGASRPRVPAPTPISASGPPAPAWEPPGGTLPGGHAHLELIKSLGQATGSAVWAARSARQPGKLLILEFPTEDGPRLAATGPGDRQVLDLSAWSGQGWPAFAVLTRLPARLAGEYARFELLSFIGLGGMGLVWMARSPDYPDLALAIKFFTHPVYRQHPALIEQCLQEARVGISIDSPNIARTYQLLDLRQHQQAGWPPFALVMPLYEPSLQQVLDDLRRKRESLAEEQVLEFARHLLAGVEALHERGLVHRDLKPSNVLFRLPEEREYTGPESLRGATALIADLGTLGHAGKPPLFMLGQDGWKAPELFDPPGSKRPNRDRVADQAEDLYALGLVLLALATTEDGGGTLPPEPSTTVGPSNQLVILRYLAKALADPQHAARQEGLRGLRDWLLAKGDTGRKDPALLALRPRYRNIGHLGAGGMGEVFLGHDVLLDRKVAIKVLRMGLRYAELQTRFVREADLLSKLEHPNIIRVFEVGETEGHPFFVMEYCAGGDLRQKIRDRPLTPAGAAALTLQLAKAMEFAHGIGVVHRDLKPANILLDDAGTPKIADFGLAFKVEANTRLTASGAVMGTPGYMAPEQARGSPRDIGPHTDIYGLGAILYTCLTGRPPFEGSHPHELLYAILESPPTAPHLLQPQVPRDLEVICLKCLAKDPVERYSSAASLAEDLERFLAERPIEGTAARDHTGLTGEHVRLPTIMPRAERSISRVTRQTGVHLGKRRQSSSFAAWLLVFVLVLTGAVTVWYLAHKAITPRGIFMDGVGPPAANRDAEGPGASNPEAVREALRALQNAASIHFAPHGDWADPDQLEALQEYLKAVRILRNLSNDRFSPDVERLPARLKSLSDDIRVLRKPEGLAQAELDRFRENCNTLVLALRDLPELRRPFLDSVLRLLRAPWNEDETRAWSEVSDSATRLTRKRLLNDLGRSLADTWQKEDPTSPQAALARAEIEFWAERYQAALQSAEIAARLAGSNASIARPANELVKKCWAKLRQP